MSAGQVLNGAFRSRLEKVKHILKIGTFTLLDCITFLQMDKFSILDMYREQAFDVRFIFSSSMYSNLRTEYMELTNFMDNTTKSHCVEQFYVK